MNEEATIVNYILMKPRVEKIDTSKFLNGTVRGWIYQQRVRVEFGSLSEIVEYGKTGQPERAVDAVANLLSKHGFEFDSEARWKEINGGYSIDVKSVRRQHEHY